MGKYLRAVRGKLAAVAVGAALLATGVGFGAHAAMSTPGTRTTSDSSEVTTPAAPTTSEAPAVTTTAPPVVQTSTADTTQPVTTQADTPAATVPAVTTTPAPEPTTPEPTKVEQQGTTAPFPMEGPPAIAGHTDSEGNTYAPMPPPPKSYIPGEPGWTPPPGVASVPPVPAG